MHTRGACAAPSKVQDAACASLKEQGRWRTGELVGAEPAPGSRRRLAAGPGWLRRGFGTEQRQRREQRKRVERFLGSPPARPPARPRIRQCVRPQRPHSLLGEGGKKERSVLNHTAAPRLAFCLIALGKEGGRTSAGGESRAHTKEGEEAGVGGQGRDGGRGRVGSRRVGEARGEKREEKIKEKYKGKRENKTGGDGRRGEPCAWTRRDALADCFGCCSFCEWSWTLVGWLGWLADWLKFRLCVGLCVGSVLFCCASRWRVVLQGKNMADSTRVTEMEYRQGGGKEREGREGKSKIQTKGHGGA